MNSKARPVAVPAHTRVIDAKVLYSPQPFVRPLILSSGAIEVITQADAVVKVEVGGVQSEGRGCIYLSDLWAWPDPVLSHGERDACMRSYCEHLADELPTRLHTPAHPLNLGLQIHDWVTSESDAPVGEQIPPLLARTVCASIFDAAIHDATGRALGRNAFDLYQEPFPVPWADALFGGDGQTTRAIASLLESPLKTTSPAWRVVGKDDDLESDIHNAVREHGYFAFKLKTMARDSEEDAARVSAVASAARRWGIHYPRITVDSNEANPDAGSVTDFLDVLSAIDEDAYRALEMIEQPTGRDIARHAFDWQPVAARKPVMVDEGLVALDSMRLAREQGWSGFALKTCKGHSFILTVAAWAYRHNMLISLQDLTNPGLSAVHAALFAAFVPTMNGVELNSPQFTPAANAGWSEYYPDLFRVTNGIHRLPDPATVGLGSGVDAQHIGAPPVT